MRAFAVLAILASTALAATLPRDDVSAPATVTLDEATESQLFDCKCPKDNYKDAGVHINQSLLWYQCAYPNGACQWNVVCVASRHHLGQPWIMLTHNVALWCSLAFW